MKRRIQSGKRWMNHADIRRGSEKARLTWDKHGEFLSILADPPPLAMDVEKFELTKTIAERLCIEQAGYAINRVLRRRGLRAMHFSPDRCHILRDIPEVRERMNGASGAAECGRIYLIHQPEPDMMLYIITHELTHLASFTAIGIMTEKTNDSPLDVTDVYTKRSGLTCHFHERMTGKITGMFVALNETVTEMLANEARQSIPTGGDLGKLINLEKMLEIEAYLPAWALVTAICTKLQPFGISQTKIRQMLTHDYFDGGHRFIQTLYAHLPEAAQLLARTGCQPKEIAMAAKQLGLDNIAWLIATQYQLDL